MELDPRRDDQHRMLLGFDPVTIHVLRLQNRDKA